MSYEKYFKNYLYDMGHEWYWEITIDAVERADLTPEMREKYFEQQIRIWCCESGIDFLKQLENQYYRKETA